MTISFNNGSSSSCSNCSGIKNLVINNAGHLIVTYDDNTIEDLGLVVGHDGANGTNFYPNEIGFEIPNADFNKDKPQGWTYLSLVDPVSLYFKTNDANQSTSTWISAPFGRGPQGAAGKSFTIDSSGTTFPTTGLVDNYTFYRTTDGTIWIYDLATTDWNGPYQFKGDRGLQGQFIINSEGDTFPSITNLDPGYTFYNTETGFLYYVIEASNGQKSWSPGILFRGPQGIKGDDGDIGPAGSDANNIYAIKNVIDTSYENALLVIGKCPAGYLVTNIEVDVSTAYNAPVTDLSVRFGGLAQSEIGGTIIAPPDYFDINHASRYIVNEVNHDISTEEEIISCIFNESVNNSSTGMMTIIVTIAKQLPITPIEDNI
ncbi:putative structural protein [Erwinia phage pEa_SNUABM_50]|uniref:Structural protein n=4 Tax=Eneladusvirus BF TaxID=2560751 RepID=A0A1S6UAN0_9CAUD|nr:tail protein [Serratia phage BF]QOI71164.1 putative structural protein [Erwinia phage pEa_SNUABM_12]QOI71708.1 putative structural protein [Erwinia phage pEa_SNUABM_47]QOI72247.1 putative structural protein [Erwinia phage pEa_SNUABM_50]QXO11373.1 hypothetical protein pEaSNUABM19_00227 [Erwinia phage pEa_SNUABM_19]QXO11921.1 hypothetical protein pEaSNUABM44_00225 [Erwinia phage pEa_SNUABM_44]